MYEILNLAFNSACKQISPLFQILIVSGHGTAVGEAVTTGTPVMITELDLIGAVEDTKGAVEDVKDTIVELNRGVFAAVLETEPTGDDGITKLMVESTAGIVDNTAELALLCTAELAFLCTAELVLLCTAALDWTLVGPTCSEDDAIIKLDCIAELDWSTGLWLLIATIPEDNDTITVLNPSWEETTVS